MNTNHNGGQGELALREAGDGGDDGGGLCVYAECID